MKNIDRNGKRIKSGMKAIFNGTDIMGETWLEHGTMRYDRSYNAYMFIADDGQAHVAIFDWQPGKRIFKYYEVTNDK